MTNKEIAERLEGIELRMELISGDDDVLRSAAALLRKIERKEYAEVVHAEWTVVDDGVDIGDGTHTECSNCGMWPAWKTSYCPHCGSKMSGGKKV